MSKKILTDDGEIIDAPIASTKPMFFKTPYNYDTDQEARECALVCPEESKTQQQFAKDSDINVILAKFMQTNDPTLLNARQPQYMNVDEEFDLQARIVTSAQVQEAWDSLPAAARNILRDPKTFADYVDHCLETGDLDPLREIGLAKPKEAPVAPSSPTAGTPAAGGDKAAPAAS